MFDNDEGYSRCDYCGMLLRKNDSVWMIGRYVLDSEGLLVGNGISDSEGLLVGKMLIFVV